jgi:hypothetical protein
MSAAGDVMFNNAGEQREALLAGDRGGVDDLAAAALPTPRASSRSSG